MKLSVVIPSYNEADNLREVVLNLHNKLCDTGDLFEIIVVDDGSSDKTPEILATLKNEISQLRKGFAGQAIFRHTRVYSKEGYGNAIITGLSIAKGDVLGWMHADNQSGADTLIKVYGKLKGDNLCFSKATRVTRNESPLRIIRSSLYNALFRIMFKGSCRDVNATPKLFRRSLYEKLNLSSRDWFIDPEIVIKAIQHGSKIGEVEIHWGARTAGSSKVRMATSFEFLKNMFRYKFLNKQ